MPGRAHLLNWRPLVKNTLRGFASIQFSSGMIVHEISIHVSHGKAWASPPSRQWIKDNAVVIDETTGKPHWDQLIEFSNKDIRDAWSKQVLAALRAEHPEALADSAHKGETR